MPITEGNMPMALPGGEAQASRPPKAASKPLLLRTPAKSQIAFSEGRKGASKTPAFWKASKRAFK
jgi:hypothetical protein